MDKLKELFKLLNRRQFLIEKCKINPDAGYNHRINGQGTNEKSKSKDLTEDDKNKTDAGLASLIDDINEAREELGVRDLRIKP